MARILQNKRLDLFSLWSFSQSKPIVKAKQNQKIPKNHEQKNVKQNKNQYFS